MTAQLPLFRDKLEEAARDPKVVARFHRKYVKQSSRSGCWLWTGKPSFYGYPLLRVRPYPLFLAHRLSAAIHGLLRDSRLFVCHRCDVPMCVNPDHLFIGTQGDNLRDMKAKGRASKGDDHWNHKLTTHKVRAIRGAYAHGKSMHSLAVRYRVVDTTIWNVVKRRTWTHVE